ncbi:adenylylsulfate kinase [Salsuginibacillus halophilus]|uniref:Adenylyl-sulfate kinase n=1 Tax=Salsuginibacillus halophilus TaxID=517424 RepID=A0A2P8H9P2_9BACI|nr:adenylyl-sulfate kinase [Salsuginibacillus halophilus]PSL42953.1 adenylylsulfate kinase [Salsuginibacillus halophilus]
MTQSTHLTWHDSEVTRTEREDLKQQKSAVLWFTGLSGSGKSTISVELEKLLFQRGVHTYRLDGDNVRHGLNQNLGFSNEDREENIRRIGEVSKLMLDAGLLTLAAFISPFQEDRDQVRSLLHKGDFIEIYVAADLSTCEARDPKGLYQKARANEIQNFTGIDSPYEAPESPEITVNTDETTVAEAAKKIIHYLEVHGYLSKEA